jgi:hypothetical protein
MHKMQYHGTMTRRTALILLLLAILTGTSAAAESLTLNKPNWSETDALAAISSVDTAQETGRLSQLASSGDSAALLERAMEVGDNAAWPLPAREFVLFELARSLGDLPAGQVSSEVTDYLASLPARVRIAHPDHPGASMPMFNVAAAAKGATVEWERQAAAAEADRLIVAGRQQWLDAYLQATPAQRAGFRRSAANYSDPELAALAEIALAQSSQHAELAILATMAGLRLGDSTLFSQSLTSDSDHSLAEMIRSSREFFPRADLQVILLSTVQQAPPPTAALVIAELAPGLLDQPAVEDLMFELLGDRQLGASAALVLSSAETPRRRARLAAVAGDSPELAAKRARLALSAMERER